MMYAAGGPLACAVAGQDSAILVSTRKSLPAVPLLRACRILFAGSRWLFFRARRPSFPSG